MGKKPSFLRIFKVSEDLSSLMQKVRQIWSSQAKLRELKALFKPPQLQFLHYMITVEKKGTY